MDLRRLEKGLKVLGDLINDNSNIGNSDIIDMINRYDDNIR
jgi:hypothetical protein